MSTKEITRTMTTSEIADRLVANSRRGDHFANYHELFAADAVSLEPLPNPIPGVPRQTTGLPAIVAKANYFHEMVETVYSSEISGPLLSGDHFALTMKQEFAIRGMGKFMLDELCVFTVKDGKIILEEYFF